MSPKVIAASVVGAVLVIVLAFSLTGGEDLPDEVSATSPTITTVADAVAPPTTAVREQATTQPPAEDTSEEVVAAVETTTTTTTTAAPIDERLPRTDAAATESDPVPVGEVVEAAPGRWDIALTEVDLDAADIVLAFADINPPPEAGVQYVLVTIEGTYLGDSVAQPVFEWAMLSGDNEYLPSIPGCGFIPDSLYDVIEIAPNESFEARVCMPVAGEDVDADLELFLHAPGDEPRFFSLS